MIFIQYGKRSGRAPKEPPRPMKWLAMEIGGTPGKTRRMAVMKTTHQFKPGETEATLHSSELFTLREVTHLLDLRRVRWQKMKSIKGIHAIISMRKPVRKATRDVAKVIHEAATEYDMIAHFLRRWKYVVVGRGGELVGTNWNIPFIPKYLRLETKKILDGKY